MLRNNADISLEDRRHSVTYPGSEFSLGHSNPRASVQLWVGTYVISPISSHIVTLFFEGGHVERQLVDGGRHAVLALVGTVGMSVALWGSWLLCGADGSLAARWYLKVSGHKEIA